MLPRTTGSFLLELTPQRNVPAVHAQAVVCVMPHNAVVEHYIHGCRLPHAVTLPRSGSEVIKTCCKCQQVKPLNEFYKNKRQRDGLSTYCRVCQLAYNQQYNLTPERIEKRRMQQRSRQRSETPEQGRQYRLKGLYGLTPEEFGDILISQGCGCAICATKNPGKKGWHVDHNHACCPGKRSCGKCVRGILCAKCNVAIAMLGDDPELMIAAAAYVTHEKDQSKKGPITPNGTV